MKIEVPVTVGMYRCFGDVCSAAGGVKEGFDQIPADDDVADALKRKAKRAAFKTVVTDPQLRPLLLSSAFATVPAAAGLFYLSNFVFGGRREADLWRSCLSAFLSYVSYAIFSSYTVTSSPIGGYSQYFLAGCGVSVAAVAWGGWVRFYGGEWFGGYARVGDARVDYGKLEVDVRV